MTTEVRLLSLEMNASEFVDLAQWVCVLPGHRSLSATEISPWPPAGTSPKASAAGSTNGRVGSGLWCHLVEEGLTEPGPLLAVAGQEGLHGLILGPERRCCAPLHRRAGLDRLAVVGGAPDLSERPAAMESVECGPSTTIASFQ
jgi:hypothetical protein